MTARVLLVDDEATVLAAYCRMLSRDGFDVAVATNGRSALEAIQAGPFDAVITDLSMPEMNGLELAERLHDRAPQVPVLIITAEPTVESAAQAIEHRAVAYLTKPVDRAALVRALSRAIDDSRSEARRRSQSDRSDALHADLEAAFDEALRSATIAFQPIVSVSERRVFAFEALVRPDHARLSSPGALIEAASTLGRLSELGRSIRHRTIESWPPSQPDVLLFVNLHPHDLFDPELSDDASPLVQIAHHVVLEVTERAALEDGPLLRTAVQGLRQRGFRLAVDDLGAGYAGLSSLVQLEPEFVKLDMELIRGIDSSKTKQKLVSSLCTLAGELGIQVVAEGVESREERDRLTELSVPLLQGYYFARPGAALPSVLRF
ncbi:MAG: EAL domain-containing protein [Deltaproteobacteria bacterium]|nr:EAL domain-containing protein [Deltaproteobacteria bacterium]